MMKRYGYLLQALETRPVQLGMAQRARPTPCHSRVAPNVQPSDLTETYCEPS
jgi:hypothetical protein